jgi:hypothetical protein
MKEERGTRETSTRHIVIQSSRILDITSKVRRNRVDQILLPAVLDFLLHKSLGVEEEDHFGRASNSWRAEKLAEAYHEDSKGLVDVPDKASGS